MPVFTYTAKRRIATGHSSGTQYSMEKAAGPLTPEDRIIKNSWRALGGNEETLLDRIETVWNLTTDWIREAELEFWQEFTASVAAGEQFTFDPYGTIAVPDAPLTVALENKAIRWARAGSKKIFTVSLTLRES